MRPEDRIILALDTDRREVALHWVDLLGPHVGQFKVGLELVNSCGFDLFQDLRGRRVFYDSKFHDIPNTVAGAARGAARHGVWMYNVHCSGGKAMMRAAREASDEAAGDAGLPRPMAIGVTVLSSIDTALLSDEMGMPVDAETQALRMARLAQEAGLDGVVAGGGEVAAIREACGPEFVVMTPGIRPGSGAGDQRRVLTPADAIRLGSTYLGIGRPVTRADDPVAALRRILDEIASVS